MAAWISSSISVVVLLLLRMFETGRLESEVALRVLVLERAYGKPNGHAQKAVMVQRGQVVGTRNTSVCSENVSSVFSYWLFSTQSYKISQGSYAAWVHNDICIVKERKMCT